MKETFLKILTDYTSLEQQLSRQAVLSDAKKYNELSKKYSGLNDVIKKIKELEQCEKIINESKQTLQTESDTDLLSIADQELRDYTLLHQKFEKEIEEMISEKDPFDEKNIIVEIRAGTGGDESTLFTAELFRMYSRFAENMGWKTKILSSNRTGLGGFKEVIFEIIGFGAYGYLKYESGTHRVQRVPETEKSGRVHTSAITVAILPEAEEIDVEIRPGDLKIDVFRAGGKGGQSVNTTDSAVRITHLPTGTVVQCQDERSQLQNKIKAMSVLRSRILAHQIEKTTKERRDLRKKQIGTGDRSEKIRTYNFPQDRITDHRIKKSWHNINDIINGNLTIITEELKKAEKEEVQ